MNNNKMSFAMKCLKCKDKREVIMIFLSLLVFPSGLGEIVSIIKGNTIGICFFLVATLFFLIPFVITFGDEFDMGLHYI